MPSFTAGWYANQVYTLRAKDRYDNYRVVERNGNFWYKLQPPNGEAFWMKFCDDGSETKLDLDPGMTLEHLWFARMPTCNSVADRSLGVKIVRHADHTFVDWRIQ